jgi:hypothetical protein
MNYLNLYIKIKFKKINILKKKYILFKANYSYIYEIF